jgi:hypothetical protein
MSALYRLPISSASPLCTDCPSLLHVLSAQIALLALVVPSVAALQLAAVGPSPAVARTFQPVMAEMANGKMQFENVGREWRCKWNDDGGGKASSQTLVDIAVSHCASSTYGVD